jgi:CubicO group peptidase (beta-lactamase class C family)
MARPRITARTASLSAAIAALMLLAGCVTGQIAATSQPTPVVSQEAKSPQRCGISDAQVETIRMLNTEVVRRGFAPGATTSILCRGKPLIAATAGYADAARKRELREDDLFRIYSMTKPLTSLAAMILVEDKRLGLDDPVAMYLPEWTNTQVFSGGDSPTNLMTVPPQRALTVRDLLRHTAGLGYAPGGPDPVHRLYVQKGIDNGGGTKVIPVDGSAPIDSGAEFSRRIASIPLLDQPGSRFRYGSATDVLGLVVEKAAGQSLASLLQARVFAPLGMKDTFFLVPADKVGRLTAAYAGKSQTPPSGGVLNRQRIDKLEQGAVGQLEDPAVSLFARPRYMHFGGAGLVSTATDYQRFLQMMLRRGSLDGVRIVSPATIAEMTRNQLPPDAIGRSSLASQGLGFGLGFATFVDPGKAPMAFPRNGYFWAGAASTYFWVDPDRELTGVVMTQVFGGDVMSFYLEMLNALYGPNVSTNSTSISTPASASR